MSRLSKVFKRDKVPLGNIFFWIKDSYGDLETMISKEIRQTRNVIFDEQKIKAKDNKARFKKKCAVLTVKIITHYLTDKITRKITRTKTLYTRLICE